MIIHYILCITFLIILITHIWKSGQITIQSLKILHVRILVCEVTEGIHLFFYCVWAVIMGFPLKKSIEWEELFGGKGMLSSIAETAQQLHNGSTNQKTNVFLSVSLTLTYQKGETPQYSAGKQF